MPPTMGRRRKTDTGLEPRVYLNHGAYYYVHPSGKWERLGTTTIGFRPVWDDS